jgi:cytochrome c oxidase subunit 4
VNVAEHSNTGHAEGAAAGHGHGITRYVIIWLTLLAFTVLTVVTGQIDLGAANIYVAMIIATTKATLVVLFFMHLWDEGGVNRLIFVSSIIFALVMLLGIFGDLTTRQRGGLPHGGPTPSKIHGHHKVDTGHGHEGGGHESGQEGGGAHAPEGGGH